MKKKRTFPWECSSFAKNFEANTQACRYVAQDCSNKSNLFTYAKQQFWTGQEDIVRSHFQLHRQPQGAFQGLLSWFCIRLLWAERTFRGSSETTYCWIYTYRVRKWTLDLPTILPGLLEHLMHSCIKAVGVTAGKLKSYSFNFESQDISRLNCQMKENKVALKVVEAILALLLC